METPLLMFIRFECERNINLNVIEFEKTRLYENYLEWLNDAGFGLNHSKPRFEKDMKTLLKIAPRGSQKIRHKKTIVYRIYPNEMLDVIIHNFETK